MAESDGGEQAKPARDMKKIFAMVYVALNLAAMGAGSFMVYVSTLGFKSPSISSEELDREIASFRQTLLDKPLMYSIDPVSTNLSGMPRRMIQVEINLEMLDAEGFEEIINLGAKGRDNIVKIVNSKTFQDLESVQGKLQFKNEIIAALNEQLERGVVKNVYFSNFVVQ